MIMSCGALRCTVWLTVFVHLKTGIIRALTKFFWHLFKSEHVRLVQYRARKQAAVSSVGRLLTRAVLYERVHRLKSAAQLNTTVSGAFGFVSTNSLIRNRCPLPVTA